MKYDFVTPLDRTGQDAIAVEKVPIPGAEILPGFSRIPMWVADMNFRTVPAIQEAIIGRTMHPAYGYFTPRDEYYEAILGWHRRRNGITDLEREHIGYENGVLGCVATAIQAFTAPGDGVLLHAPCYIGFQGVMKNNGRRMVFSELYPDANNVWRMDYEDMDRKLKKYNIHLAVFCSPHNPTGRVWEREEIEAAMEIYRRNDCIVVSDEIWSDLILRGHRHIPTGSVSGDAANRTIAIYAPSKTFNLAGLIGSYHIIRNPLLRQRMEKQASLSHYNTMNVLSMYALIGAYGEEGHEWVDELTEVLTENIRFACDFIRARFDGVSITEPEGTYMLYLDCRAWCEAHGCEMDELLRRGVSVGVIWQDGRPFRRPWTIRLNLALPKALVREAMERLEKYVFGETV